MKVRESGMPPRDYWETLLDVPRILDAFGFDADTGDVAEVGCGYGTFTLPLAHRIRGIVHAFDLEPEMIAITEKRAAAASVSNVRARARDVITEGFDAMPESCGACLLFNILHGENPHALLRAARDVVQTNGLVAVIHWRSDIVTPRGPSLDIRPKPEQIIAWSSSAGLTCETPVLDLPPWHFGLALRRS